MTKWLYQDGTTVKELTEDKLRKKLDSGDLSGLELCRPESDSTWRPLHAWPVFAEVVPFTGAPRLAAVNRARTGFAWHLFAFGGVLGFLTLQTGAVPAWSIFWLMGLAAHAFKTLPALWPQPSTQETQAPAPEALPAEVPLHELPESGFLQQVTAVLKELGQSGAERVDVEALREGATALDDALDGLTRASDPEAGVQLQQDLAEAEERVHAAPDEASAEIFREEARAIVARLDAWTAAANTISRLQARQRTLLHQLHALQLDLTRGEMSVSNSRDPVREQVARLRQEALAASEVEEDLARARRLKQAT